jgi:hypothetical protein
VSSARSEWPRCRNAWDGIDQAHVPLEARLGHGEGVHLGLLVAHDATLLGHARETRGHGDREDRHEQDDQGKRHAAPVGGQSPFSHAGS